MVKYIIKGLLETINKPFQNERVIFIMEGY